ncbi:hypothetical protein PIROE2DRAFT_61949 [Piromyces sp. E2]|nr:hypothetical protein PIROE2DRAFT_61949 [Piromyces sp. E2]|eukprot:OUM62362.1 hypothetical protein PIROE2DRAFT_61949 [Piromyces sp. E2]
MNASSTPQYYEDNGSERDPKSLIKCVNGGCKVISSVGYYIDSNKLYYCKSSNSCDEVTKNTSSVPVYYLNNGDNMDSKPLIKCANSKCETITALVGGYIKEKTKRLIYCESDTVCYEPSENTTTTPKYYLNNGGDKESKPLIKCDKNGCVIGVAFVGYFIDGENNSLIHCENSTVCSGISSNTTSVDYYYLNSGVDKSSKPLIKCVNSKCTSMTASTGYYLNSTNNGLINCKSTNSCEEVSKNNSNISKYYLHNGSDKNIKPLIKCNKNGCETIVATIGSYVNSANNSLIYCDKGYSCKEGDKNTTDISKYYLNNGDDNGTNPIIRCDKTNCTTMAASIGSYINSINNHVLYCEKTSICNEVTINNTSTPKYYINKGDGKNVIPLIICVSGSCKTSTPSIGGYINDANNGAIYCISTSSCSEVSTNTSDISKYYLNNGSDKTNNPLIKCVNSTCQTMKASVGFYIESENDLVYCENENTCSKKDKSSTVAKYYLNNGDNLVSKPLIVCANNSCSTSSANVGGYINGAKNDLIYCVSATNCEEIGVNNTNVPKYYLNKGGDLSSKPIIKCEKSGCTSLQASSGGYINAINNGLIYCQNSTACNQSTPSYGYYLNKGEGNGDKLMFCLNKVCSNTTGKDGKFYVNGGNNKELIRCSSSGCRMHESSKPLNNYFMSGSTYENDANYPLIRCSNGTCGIYKSVIYWTSGGVFTAGYISGLYDMGVIYCQGETGTNCSEIKIPDNATLPVYYQTASVPEYRTLPIIECGNHDGKKTCKYVEITKKCYDNYSKRTQYIYCNTEKKSCQEIDDFLYCLLG